MLNIISEITTMIIAELQWGIMLFNSDAGKITLWIAFPFLVIGLLKILFKKNIS